MQYSESLQRARILRKKATPAEKYLWQAIKNRKFINLKFRRQYWIDNYIADFTCLEYKLIIELDGNYHKEQQEYDIERTDVLSSFNFKVLRFWNWQVLNNLPIVLQEIAENIKYLSNGERPLRQFIGGEGADEHK